MDRQTRLAGAVPGAPFKVAQISLHGFDSLRLGVVGGPAGLAFKKHVKICKIMSECCNDAGFRGARHVTRM